MKHKSWEQYQVILFFEAPPSPPESHVSFVTAYCRSLPLIAQSVHYNAFDTQLKKVSARKHRSHIFLVYSYPGLTSKCDRMLLSLIQLMAGLLCTTNCVVFIEKFTQTKQNFCLLKALNHVA